MRPMARPEALECADLAALSGGDLLPSNANGSSSWFRGPLNAALLWRQVAKAAIAVTSHRTPKLRGPGANVNDRVTHRRGSSFFPCHCLS